MILTITPNAAVDKTYRIEQFALNRVNRPSAACTVAGGKGINVARVYQTLGGEAITTGFLAGANGAVVAEALAAERIRSEFVQVDGESRICIAVIDPTTGSQTEINESGPTVSPHNTRDLLETVRAILSKRRFDFVVMSGSLPPGASETLYADLIRLTRSSGIRSVLDSSGAPFRLGVEAAPWMIKPNHSELEGLLGRPLADKSSVVGAAANLKGKGIEVVAITLGAEGAILAVGGAAPELWESIPPKIDFASAVASGDAFLAAFLFELGSGGTLRNKSERFESALRLATGAGAANAAVIGAGFCSKSAILSAAAGVNLAKIAWSAC